MKKETTAEKNVRVQREIHLDVYKVDSRKIALNAASMLTPFKDAQSIVECSEVIYQWLIKDLK